MIYNKKLCSLIGFVLVAAMMMNTFGTLSVYAVDDSGIGVTASTNYSVNQGEGGYCYVSINSLSGLATLSVTVHFDPTKVQVESDYVYNTIECVMNDKAVGESSVQFSYIFDGNGEDAETQLFYFMYTVLPDAEAGGTYFDIVVNEAYDSSLHALAVAGSRCAFMITEQPPVQYGYVYSDYEAYTSVGEEFELAYQIYPSQIASGALVINYDPELFEVVDVTSGGFLDNKFVDTNEALEGAVYVSFVGTEYVWDSQLMTVRFKTLKNVADTSTVKMTVTELYDLDRNPISCEGFSTTVNVAFDAAYTEDAPSMSLQAKYNAADSKVVLTVMLDKDSRLGAGDFVIEFDADNLTFNSVQKGFSPTFFNINTKNVENGILKFSIISLMDITDEKTVMTVVFDVATSCETRTVDFEISGTGLKDSLTINDIMLNFVDASVSIPYKHTESATVEENRAEATCTEDGRYDSVVYCSVCKAELSRETKTINKLGHDHSREWTVDTEPTCTTAGSKSHHCTRCGDKADVTEIPANGHSYGEWYEISAPTCTAKGTEEHKCSVCKNTETRAIDANGHTESAAVEENREEATCTEDGSYDSVVYCSVCKAELSRETKIINKLGHSFGDWIFVDSGKHRHTCTCGHTEIEDHVFGDDGICVSCNRGKAIPGDLDGDYLVTQEDAVYLLLHTMFGEIFYPLNGAPGDMDGSGKVDQDDAIYLLLHTMFGEMFYPLNIG